MYRLSDGGDHLVVLVEDVGGAAIVAQTDGCAVVPAVSGVVAVELVGAVATGVDQLHRTDIVRLRNKVRLNAGRG